MKKNFSVNISGILFQIDDDAYELLKDYLQQLKNHFHHSEGSEEILSDIESRIAEMLQQRCSESKKVITIQDVETIIGTMGRPDELGDDSNEKKEQSGYSFRTKRFFRDGENRMLGGVASGIAAYFRTDPLWIRLGFVLVTLFGFGFGVVMYLILWMVAPVARTTAEKLEMHGEAVNISNIEKSIKEEVDDLKNRFNDLKEGASQRYKTRRQERYSQNDRFISFLMNLIKYFAKALAIFIGIVFIAVGLSMIIGFIIGWNSPLSEVDTFLQPGSHITFSALCERIIDNSGDYFLATTGFMLLLGVPLIMLVFTGVKLIFNIHYRHRLIGLSAFSVWFVGLIFCLIAGLNIAKQFRYIAAENDKFILDSANRNCFYLQLDETDFIWNGYKGKDFSKCQIPFQLKQDGKNLAFSGCTNIDLLKSDDNTFQITVMKKSRGKSPEIAGELAKAIHYKIEQKDSVICLKSAWTFPAEDPWRNQNLKVLIKVPVGKQLYLPDNLWKYLDNKRFEYPEEYIAGYWIMTENGMKKVKERM